MQQADYQHHRPTPWMQDSVSMHKIPTPVRHLRMNKAKLEEEEKEKWKTEARRLTAHTHTKKKHWRNWNEGHLGIAQFNKVGEECLTSPVSTANAGDDD